MKLARCEKIASFFGFTPTDVYRLTRADGYPPSWNAYEIGAHKAYALTLPGNPYRLQKPRVRVKWPMAQWRRV